MTESESRRTGKIKFFDSRAGFGFIKPDDGTRDVFLSINRLPKDHRSSNLMEQRCSFTVAEGPKGPFAQEFELL